MSNRRAITEDERVLLHLKKGEAKRARAEAIPIPWPASDGLALFDAFSGAEAQELPLPADLAATPDVLLYTIGDTPAFLAQCFRERPAKTWKLLGTLGVDSAALCLTPRGFVPREVSAEALDGALRELHDGGRWKTFALEGRSMIGVDIHDDGLYDLYVGRDEDGADVAWTRRRRTCWRRASRASNASPSRARRNSCACCRQRWIRARR